MWCEINKSDNLLGWFPTSWRSFMKLLTACRSLDSKMLEVSWRKRMPHGGNREGRPIPDWFSLLKALTNQEPLLDDEGIRMCPRFVLLPFHVQRSLLTFLESHKSELPVNMLKQFVKALQDYVTDDWSRLHLHLLNIHVINAYSTSTEQSVNSGFISQSSSAMFENLCEQIERSKKLGPGSCQLSSDWMREATPMQMGHSNWLDLKSHVKRTERESSNVRKRKLSDGSKEGIDNPNAPFDKRLKLDAAVEDIFPTEEAETAKDTELVDKAAISEPIDAGSDPYKPPSTDLWKEKLEARYSPLQEFLQSTRGSLTTVEADLMKSFVALPLTEIEAISNAVAMDSLNTTALAAVCQQLVAMPTNYISFTSTKMLAHHLFHKKVSDLQQTAPRSLVVTMCQFAQMYPKPLLDGCIIPYLQGGTLGAHQVDLILKVAKESLEDDGRLSLFRAVLVTRELKWSEPVTIFMQGLINMKTALAPETLDELFPFLEVHHTRQDKCPKFGKLVVAIINKSQKQLTDAHKRIIQGIIATNKTFLKKALAASLKKCS